MQFGCALITGGAGFVGSNLAIDLKRRAPQLRVIALDNLSRRGSELNLPRLRRADIEFVHGDVRCPEDFQTRLDFDLLIDCSAEPSVQAGATSSPPTYVLNTNLTGTLHCLEAARRRQAAFLFLSTSRVYPIALLNGLPYVETQTRFDWQTPPPASDGSPWRPPGFSECGVNEAFPLTGARSFYGTSKLAGEMLLQEYVHSYGLRGLINRCGVLAGPWQMGKVDQGVITLWVARHHFEQPLRYIGFDGSGKQVRDVLHIADLCDLVWKQLQTPHVWQGQIYNVGGGRDVSVSLRELTDLCAQTTAHRVPIGAESRTSDLDLRIYLTDASAVRRAFDWSPQRSITQITQDIHQWIVAHEGTLRTVLA